MLILTTPLGNFGAYYFFDCVIDEVLLSGTFGANNPDVDFFEGVTFLSATFVVGTAFFTDSSDDIELTSMLTFLIT